MQNKLQGPVPRNNSCPWVPTESSFKLEFQVLKMGLDSMTQGLELFFGTGPRWAIISWIRWMIGKLFVNGADLSHDQPSKDTYATLKICCSSFTHPRNRQNMPLTPSSIHVVIKICSLPFTHSHSRQNKLINFTHPRSVKICSLPFTHSCSRQNMLLKLHEST